MLEKVEAGYFVGVNKVMYGIKNPEIQKLIKSMETIRNNGKKGGLI